MKSILCFTVLFLKLTPFTFAQYAQLSNNHICGVDETVPYFDPYAHSPSGSAICTDPSVIRYLPVAFHFLLRHGTTTFPVTDRCSPPPPANPLPNYTYFGPGNFTEYDDGRGNFDYTGYDFVDDIIQYANSELSSNSQQWRQNQGSTYPSPPPLNNIRYVTAGVYFHRDNNAYEFVNSVQDREDIQIEYSVSPNKFINVYFTGPALNSTGVANGFGGALKYNFNDLYLDYLRCTGWANTVFSAQTLNHEIGHNLSLFHTWSGDDECIDSPEGFEYDRIETPNNACSGTPTCCKEKANCWTLSNASGCPLKPCDVWPKVSNNIMDYNQAYPHAYTSCQISRINADLAGQGNNYIYSCDGCMPSFAFFAIDEAFVCQGEASVILDGRGSFNETQYQIELCPFNPSTGLCTGSTFSTGWIQGNFDFHDLSEDYNFVGNTYYKIKIRVDNVDCEKENVFEKIVYVKLCTVYNQHFTFEIANPRYQTLEFNYTVGVSGTLVCAMVNASTGHTSIVMPQQSVVQGTYSHSSSIAHLPAGSYYLLAYLNGGIAQAMVLKI